LRLVEIHVRDFRAFPGEFKLALKDGCNLLLHGENGSGKSSLALALREFFTLDRPFPRPIEPYAHIFADPTNSQPMVQLTFSSPAGNEEIRWQKASDHPLQVGLGTQDLTARKRRETLMSITRCSGFFDYRALLRASLSSKAADLPGQLFHLLVEDLLAGFRVKASGSEVSLGGLWSGLKWKAPSTRHERRMREANNAAKGFDDAFRPFLDQLVNKANEYLAFFPNHRMKFRFEYPGSSFAKDTKQLTGTAIYPVIEFNGTKVDSHHEFLNEARLTALALSMFLAAVKLGDADPENVEPLRLLSLDDVLIGLDLNNRLPLLELLRQEFPKHQIILLTHDLVWFEIAKEHTGDWGSWCYARLFEEPTGPAEPYYPRFERLKPQMDDLDVAAGYLHTGDLRAAAVYVRAAYENRLKNICEKNGIEVGYKGNPKEVKADSLWRAILRRHAKRVREGREFLEPGLIPRVSAVRSAVLNRLSHSGASSLTSAEIATALQTVTELRNTKIPFKS